MDKLEKRLDSLLKEYQSKLTKKEITPKVAMENYTFLKSYFNALNEIYEDYQKDDSYSKENLFEIKKRLEFYRDKAL